MQQHNDHFSGHRQKRRPRPRSRHTISDPGNVTFRVVCHVSIIGGVMWSSGSIISQIRRDTSCFIHCDKPVQDSDHRVILVGGSAFPERTIELQSSATAGDNCDDDGMAKREKVVVSEAQEALLRVLERMWEVGAESGGVVGGGEGEGSVMEGYCGLLAKTTQIGAVVGRGGKCIVKMRRESGAGIRILQAPHVAAKDDELIQITGTILSVKKALVAVTGILQECPPYDKDPGPMTRPGERASHGDSQDLHGQFFPHLYTPVPNFSENSAKTCSSSADANTDLNPDRKTNQQEVSFRLLCSNGAAGSIIGTRGTIVRALQNETGASIMFASPRTMSGERVVTISALENLESLHSPAQNAVVSVFGRSIEHGIEKKHPSDLIKGTTVTARLLVALDAVCCLSGGGTGIDTPGADIQILERDRALDCALQNDVVVQITGQYKNVQNALFQVTRKLRDNLLPNEMLSAKRESYGRMREIVSPRLQQSSAHDADQETSLARGMDRLRLSSRMHEPLSPGLQLLEKLERGGATTTTDNVRNSITFGGGSEHERSLHFPSPRVVLNEVGEKKISGGIRETTNAGLHSLLSPSSSKENVLKQGNNKHGIRVTTSAGLHSSLSPSSSKENVLKQGNNKHGLSNDIGGPSTGLELSQNVQRGHTVAITEAGTGSTTFRGSAEIERMKFATVANTTMELIVSEDILDSLLYGEDGGNLARLRQLSGAKVEVCDNYTGKSEGTVVLSGTLDQTSKAQKLLDAFIIADHLFLKQEIELSLIGLQNAGKTSLLNIIATGQYSEDMIPTVGLNMRKVTKGNATIELWDLGGQPRFRSMWERYCRAVAAIVYVVDAADPDNLSISRSELHDLLSKQSLNSIPLLVLGNKIDKPGALSMDALIDEMRLKLINDREVCCFMISCRNSTNIDSVIDWLVRHSKSKT